MAARKIVLLGGGSLLFHKIIIELATIKEISGSEIVLYDKEKTHMEIIEEIGRISEGKARCCYAVLSEPLELPKV